VSAVGEARSRVGEMLSLVSCTFNIVVGTGDREITLSAGSWELRRRGSRRGRLFVAVIDAFHNTPDHCERAWRSHAGPWAKVRAEGRPAPPPDAFCSDDHASPPPGGLFHAREENKLGHR